MKRGFTLIELLIAFGMSAMIFMTVSSLLVTLLATNTKSRRQEVFEQVKNDLYVELVNTVRWGKEVGHSGGELVVDENIYGLENGVFMKNGSAFTSGAIEITRFEVISRSRVDDRRSYLIEIEMRDRSFNLSQDKLTLVVSQRRTEVEQ